MHRLTALATTLLIALATGAAQAQVGAMIRGTAVDEDGRPLQGVKVEIQFEGNRDLKPKTYTQTTNNKGYFARVGLPDGAYKLVLSKEGFAPTTLNTNISLGGLSDLGTIPLRAANAPAPATPAASPVPAPGDAPAGAAPGVDAAAIANQQEKVRKLFIDAVAAAKAGNYDQAETLYKEIVAEAPMLGVAHSSLGYVYRQKKDWTSAEASYRKAIELQPDDSDNYVALAWVQQARGQTDQAVQTLSEATPKFEHNAKFLFSAGLLYYDSGKAEQAIENLQKARALDPANPEPLYYLGLLAIQKNQVDEGRKQLEQYIAASGQNPRNLATAQGLLKALKK